MIRLVIVTVLLAVVAAFTFVRGRGNGLQRTVKVTARAGLARGSSIAVVEIDGRRFLLGAAANAVNVLAELDPVGPAGPTDHEPPAGPAPRSPLPSSPLPTGPTTDDGGTSGPIAGGTPLDRLRSMTVRTPGAARRPFQVGP